MIYLYDSKFNRMKETTYKKLSNMFNLQISTLESYKSSKRRLDKRYYIVDELTIKEKKEFYSKYQIKNEIWKEIEGSDGEFLISDYGRFKRKTKTGKERFILPYFKTRKVDKNKDTQFIKVKFKEKYKEYNVARLVAYHFVEIFYESDSVIRKSKPLKYKNYTLDDVVVFHKNGITYDNYFLNLEYLDREDLAKKTAHKSNKYDDAIVAIDVLTNEIVGYYRSTRMVAKDLPVSKQAVCDSLNKRWKTNIVGGRYKFIFEKDLKI